MKTVYEIKRDHIRKELAEVFERILKRFPGKENDQIREDIANYTIGYMGLSFGPHVKR